MQKKSQCFVIFWATCENVTFSVKLLQQLLWPLFVQLLFPTSGHTGVGRERERERERERVRVRERKKGEDVTLICNYSVNLDRYGV